MQQHSWDFVVYLTDLPSRSGGDPVLYDVNDSTAAALVCLPVLGVVRVKAKVRALLRRLVRAGTRRDGVGPSGSDDLPPATCSGAMSRIRLLGGMVLNNRPTRMVTGLAGVVAAGAGTGAFGVFYGSIASLAVALHPMRLLLIGVLGVLTLVSWLILRNGMWTRSDDEFGRGHRRMDNAATVLTVGVGVGIMFLALLVAMFVLAIVVLDAGYLETQLGRPVSVSDYFRLAWLSTCLGAFAGALGSNFDDEDVVRAATYSLRWHERRTMFDDYQRRAGERREQRERQRIESENSEDSGNSGGPGNSEDDANGAGGTSTVEDDRPRG